MKFRKISTFPPKREQTTHTKDLFKTYLVLQYQTTPYSQNQWYNPYYILAQILAKIKTLRSK